MLCVMRNLRIFISIVLIVGLLAACQKQLPEKQQTEFEISNEKITLNPNGTAPLTALLEFTSSSNIKCSIRVVGKNGAESDVLKDFDGLGTTFALPVLGLYAGYNNTVEVTFKNDAGTMLGRKSYTIKTDALPAGFYPNITINSKQPARMAPGMTFVSYFGYKDKSFPESPFVFDAFGDIRWYADFNGHPILGNLFFDDGMERLKNGNFYFGDINSNAIYEMNIMGKIINTYPLPGYQFHHNVQEKPNGNFLVTVTKQGSPTVEDYIIEIDRSSKQIIRTWDLHQSLQYYRRSLIPDEVDWIHVNAVVYDETDNTIIISGRTQGMVKLDENNKVVWILGCHMGWGFAGDGTDLKGLLLTPLDNNNQPITDIDVLNGIANTPDFEWNWYQHAPLLMPNGHIMLFDNGGDNRNFSGSGQYSRAVEYEINSTNKTVKQIWQYGKERGAATFSHIVSDVDYIAAGNHVIFSPGAVNNATNYGKVVEVDYATKDVLFEATITPPQTFYGITFHRTERLSLYE